MPEAEMNDAMNRSEDDVLAELLGTVRQAMTRAVLTLEPDMRTGDAAAMLRRYGVGGAPVLDAGRLVGVVTEADLLASAPRAQTTGPFLRPRNRGPDWCIRDVMSAGPIVACADEPLTEAIVRMDERGIDRLPVVDPRLKTVGILAREDIVHAVALAARRRRSHTDERRPEVRRRSWTIGKGPIAESEDARSHEASVR
jgi:CBS domain-containing protein